jgi:hypothetical protein
VHDVTVQVCGGGGSLPARSQVLSRITRAPIPDLPFKPVPVRSRPFRPFRTRDGCNAVGDGDVTNAQRERVLRTLGIRAYLARRESPAERGEEIVFLK